MFDILILYEQVTELVEAEKRKTESTVWEFFNYFLTNGKINRTENSDLAWNSSVKSVYLNINRF